MKVSDALNISDLRKLAKRRLPRMVFDYIDGGADDEVTLKENVTRFSDYKMLHNVLVDVSKIDLKTDIFGSEMNLPFAIAPTASSRLFNPREGERGVARAAAKANMIYSISTLGSVSIEEIGEINPGPKWFQVYVWRDRELVVEILKRIRAAGFTGVILTVDLPVAGNRERDPRNGFSIPPKINRKTAFQALARPGYIYDIMTTPKIGPVNFPPRKGVGKGIIEFVNSQFDNSVTWEYAAWLKEAWGGPFMVKGISNPGDAGRAIDAGADGVWISNHGGRQLDTSLASIDALPAIAETVGGRAKIIMDGGIRRGSDIAKALCLGADVVAIGRAYLFGLAAGGEEGVDRAVTILKSELIRTMQLLGARSISELNPGFIVPPHDVHVPQNCD